jgi:hypothetical protein
MEYRIELTVWTAGSVLLAAAGAQVAWRAERKPQGRIAQFRAWLTGNLFGRAFLFLLRFLYYFGLPYVAVLRHALSLVVIGLVGTQTSDLPWWMLGWNLSEWAGALGWAIGLGGLAAAALAWGWWNARRALEGDLPSGGLLPAPSLLVTARESLYAEIHWAFYRAAPLLFMADPYWATLAGAALVVVEWSLDPYWRAGLANGSRREVLLTQMAWLALSTAIFALARNVWPIIVLHSALAWALGRWVALLSAQTGVAPRAESPPLQLRKARRM